MKNKTKYRVLRGISLALSVGLPAGAALACFPLSGGEPAAVKASGLCVLLLALAAVPAMRVLGLHIKTPSAWMLWTLIFIVSAALSAVIDRLVVVSFFGAVGNAAGAALWKMSGKYRRDAAATGGKTDKEPQADVISASSAEE